MGKYSANTSIVAKTVADTTVLVKANTPYVSALKRLEGILRKFDKSPTGLKKYQNGEYKRVKYIVVKGMGKAMERTVAVALHHQQQGYKVDFYTGTVEVFDKVPAGEQYETKDDDSEPETELKARKVAYVECRIWLKGL